MWLMQFEKASVLMSMEQYHEAIEELEALKVCLVSVLIVSVLRRSSCIVILLLLSTLGPSASRSLCLLSNGEDLQEARSS